MFDKRTKLSYEVVEEVKAFFKSKVFRTMIPRNIKLAEAPSFGKSAIVYDKSSRGARAYMTLADEIIENLKLFQEQKLKEESKKENEEKKQEDIDKSKEDFEENKIIDDKNINNEVNKNSNSKEQTDDKEVKEKEGDND